VFSHIILNKQLLKYTY